MAETIVNEQSRLEAYNSQLVTSRFRYLKKKFLGDFLITLNDN